MGRRLTEEEREEVWPGSAGWCEVDVLVRSLYLANSYRIRAHERHVAYYDEVIAGEDDPDERELYKSLRDEPGEEERADHEVFVFLLHVMTSRGHVPASRVEAWGGTVTGVLGDAAIPEEEVRMVVDSTPLMKLFLLRQLWITCDDMIREFEPVTRRSPLTTNPPDPVTMCHWIVRWLFNQFKSHVPGSCLVQANAVRPEEAHPDMVLYMDLMEIAEWDLCP